MQILHSPWSAVEDSSRPAHCCRDFRGESQQNPRCSAPGFGQKHPGALCELHMGLAVVGVRCWWGWGCSEVPCQGWEMEPRGWSIWEAGIVPDTQTQSMSCCCAQGSPQGPRVLGLAREGGTASSSHLAPALLSLLQDFRAGHWIFHPVLPDDVPGRAVLSQTPGGLPLHHPH